MRPIPGATALLVIDIQTRLLAAMPEPERPRFLKAARNLVALATEFRWPVVVTEQYPRGLGPTIPELEEEIAAVAAPCRVEKLCFSACREPQVLSAVSDAEAVVLVGMEAHVCVLETALDLLERGKRVLVPWDGVLSREERDRRCGLELLRSAGGWVTSSETLIFQTLERAGGATFKTFAARVR